MYKTREDVEAMIEIIGCVKVWLRDFGFWIVSSLSIPQPGVLHSEPIDKSDDSV